MEKQDTPTQIISKYALRGFLVCAGIALICVLLYAYGCDREPKPVIKPEIDTLTPRIIKNNQTIQIHADSTEYFREQARKAWERKNFYKQKYLSLFDSLYSVSDSACKINLQLVNQAKLKQDSAHDAENMANLSVINSQGKQIKLYQENQTLYDLRHKKDSTWIKNLTDSIPKAYRLGLKKGRRQGFIVGAVIVEAVNLGAKIKS